MNAVRVTTLRHHCVHYVNRHNSHSNDVDYKGIFCIVCRYIVDYVLPSPQQRGPSFATLYKGLNDLESARVSQIFSLDNNIIYNLRSNENKLSS